MLRTRVLTALVMLAVVLAALFLLPRTGWIAFCAVFLGIAAWEWGALTALASGARYAFSGLLVVLFVLPSVLQPAGANGLYAPVWVYYAGALFWAILVPLWMWRRPRIQGRFWLLAAGALVLLPAFAAVVELRAVHPWLLIGALVIVWISDTAAYFVGVSYGRHKLAPTISPGKTWEGVAGALVAVAVYALVWASLGSPAGMAAWPGGPRMWMLPVLLGLAVVGMIGDLFESLIKRQAGVKDSGTFLPGHGGLLDRIDAPAAMLPFAVLAFVR
jgi:phosphatidate cytidylyltransferase